METSEVEVEVETSEVEASEVEASRVETSEVETSGVETSLGYPVVIINWVHYLGPPGPSTSQILGTFSRFSETFLAEREGGSLGDPPGP